MLSGSAPKTPSLRAGLEWLQAIEQTGTYEHTFDELLFEARLAWRIPARCVGRLFWNGLHLEDARHVTDTDGMFEALKRHLALAARGGSFAP